MNTPREWRKEPVLNLVLRFSEHVEGEYDGPWLEQEIEKLLDKAREEERERVRRLVEGKIDRAILYAEEPMDDQTRAIKLRSVVLAELLTALNEKV